jgi:hypothetical protein
MIDLDLLEECGITTKALKAKFEAEVLDDKAKELVDLIQSRVIKGRDTNLRDYRTYWAIDCAYDAPFQQRDVVLIQAFLNRGGDTASSAALCKQWGLNDAELFYTETGKDGLPVKKIRQQHFFRVLVPIVKSYVTIRRAKMFNDRNTYPFLKYEPISFTTEKRLLCEVVTDVVQRMSSAFGFPSYLSQVILQTLLYGHCLMFVKEPWFSEYQMVGAAKYTVAAGDTIGKLSDKFNVSVKELKDANPDRAGKLTVGEEITIPKHKECVKEGLRYETPHPTRSFFDLTNPQNTINTDTGCRYAGYWRVMRYGELKADPLIWNKDKITWGNNNNWFAFDSYKAFWEEVYPCVQTLPACAGGNAGPPTTDRVNRSIYYINTDADAAVFLTNIFMKIIPSQYGLGDYDCPVWFQFIVANDSSILWAAPIPYNPILYTGYDADTTRYPQSSMALEITPFQTQLGNILSQILFTARQGLWKVIPFDTDLVDPEMIRQLNNQGSDYAGANFLPYSSQRMRTLQNDPGTAFRPIELACKSSAEMTNQIQVIIDILERLLGMSSSEVGAPASHEQTAEEIRVVNTNTTVRVDFTGTFIDDFINAWKIQIYYASLAYMDDEYISQVNPTPENMAALIKLGFDTVQEPAPGDKNPVEIRVKKEKMVLDGFSSDRTSSQSISSPAVGAIILQGVQAISSNPLLMQSVGSPAILDMLTQALILAGAPRDFKLRADPAAGPDAQAQQMQQQVAQMAQQLQQNILKQVGEGIKPMADAIKANGEQDAQTVQALKQTMEKLAQLTQQAQQSDQQIQQLGQAMQQVGQVTAQTKQEADATAQAVAGVADLLKTQHAATVQPAPAGTALV